MTNAILQTNFVNFSMLTQQILLDVIVTCLSLPQSKETPFLTPCTSLTHISKTLPVSVNISMTEVPTLAK
jgi:hypothetical protein